MKNKRRKKSPLPKEDHDRLMKMKETLLNIKKMLNEAKEEAEALDEEKKKEDNILIFRKD